ncbi:MAG TPA: TlpA disulfide reductase family protein [Steroidobacteraceae bacterium]|nr:TlpA disulfide reductase family protein [Steroidobacteraceae bacterium]
MFPLFSPLTSAAETLDLDAYKGKVIYLDFWASWCAPCRESFPWMDIEQELYGGRGLVVIGLNLDQERSAADRFITALKPHFKIDFDPQGFMAEKFSITGMPSTVLIDRHGKVRFTHIGFKPQDKQALDAEVRTLLDEQ